MPGLLVLCEKYFGSKDLYEVLKISKTAVDKEVRKAYHKMSLLVHPDRVDEVHKLNATEKFKVLGKIHSILSDECKRAAYDETGCFDDDDDVDEMNWKDYWGRMFKEITIEDINKYEQEYKGSEEELKDLKRAYVDMKGDMDYILEAVPFTSTSEEERIRALIDAMIERDEVPAFDGFVNESPRKRERRKRKWEKEAKYFERVEKVTGQKCSSLGDCSIGADLVMAITQQKKQREANMPSFLDKLAEKYSHPTPKRKSSGTTRVTRRSSTPRPKNK